MTTQMIEVGRATYTVEIDPKKSITITCNGQKSNRFEIGDQAEYDSWNLHYVGQIVAITEKTVTIDPRYGERKRRLKISEFTWRNHDFDAEVIAMKNSETMNYI